MNKKLLVRAAVLGTALGILVLHPLWVSMHAFDGMHGEDYSWLDFAMVAYTEVFEFEHLLHPFVAIFAGLLLAFLVLITRVRQSQRKCGSQP